MVRPLLLPFPMLSLMWRLVVLAAMLMGQHMVVAQTAGQPGGGRVEILNADALRFDQQSGGAQRLNGNVRLKHGNALMYCDSAHVYPDQRVNAFGQVRIEQGDSLRMTGDRLAYNGNDRMARMEGNVLLNDRSMELSTPALDYDLRARVGVYNAGGRIVDLRENNVLTSGSGKYLANTHRFIFSRNVRLDHPERTVTCDTMHYVTTTGITEFMGPTTITQGSTVINTTRGTYDTRNERTRFSRRSSILANDRILEGDSLRYDRRSGIGQAWGHVQLVDSGGDLRVLGDVAHYRSLEHKAYVTGHAELVLRMGADTLFLHSDTVFTATDSTGRRITARRHVRFFRSDLQGVCDTLVYADVDSVIHMHHRPALWSGNDQITGDRVSIALKNGQAHRLYVEGNAFMISEADSIHLDQVTGLKMTGYFEANELRRLVAEGNTRTVYFARETQEDGTERIMGVNRADCSSILVGLENGAIATVSFVERPDAVLYPLDKAPPEELRMKGTELRSAERPLDRAAIFP
jgi:lipopolysaccharide export system protein LptA